jgi:cellulose synthase/poly-beta-1,6-N-acetylglucosamine synthase-like glycosyltransferase
MIIFLALILCVYLVTIAQLIHGFGKIRTFHLTTLQPKTFFSIVVPFRNERDNLPVLLESIKNLNYPIDQFEIILIDDFSEDDSVAFVYNWRIQNGEFQFTLLENIKGTGAPKKDAISRAIPIAKQQWIITTDADCTFNKDWLVTLDNYIQNHDVVMLVGAVTYDCKKFSFLHHFQQLDLASLQGATIGGFGLGLGFMCNGANFAYQKSLFQELGGFSGNKQIASGDDVFLLQKAVAKSPERVHYLKAKNAIVQTQPTKNWAALFQQRLRWASKTGAYQSVFGKDLAVIVFAGNLAILLGLAATILNWISWLELAILFTVKFIFDCILLYKTNRFLTHKRMRFLIGSSVLYPFFCVLVALWSLGGNYKWKGRKFKS